VTTPEPARDALIGAGHALFVGDPTDEVLTLASTTHADALVVPYQAAKWSLRMVVAAASLAFVCVGLTEGSEAVAAMGVGVAKPPEAACGCRKSVRAG
jgi:hypothetical protein